MNFHEDNLIRPKWVNLTGVCWTAHNIQFPYCITQRDGRYHINADGEPTFAVLDEAKDAIWQQHVARVRSYFKGFDAEGKESE